MSHFFSVARQRRRVPKKAAVETVSDMSHSFGWSGISNAGAFDEQS
ncbi:hypothetical protein M2267_000522 [Ensifer sp. KUDG1]